MTPLDIFALIVLFILVGLTIGIVVWLAMLPGKAAARRGHPQADAIRIAGWLGLVTGIVWILALIWAYTRVGAGASNDPDLAAQLDEIRTKLAKLEQGPGATEGATS